MSIIKNGSNYSIVDFDANFEKLPAGNYMLRFNQLKGYFLEEKEGFKLPSKVYGDHSVVYRWLKSWKYNSEKNLGILLTGLKGAGKTITAQKFCIESGLPVIIISEEFFGSDFVNFLTKPEIGEAIIFIDEFEKIYGDSENQFDILSLMDGNFSTKLIFILTVNSYKINDYLINRPNRIKYVKQYNDLESSIVEEVLEDLLINKEHKDSVYNFFKKVNIVTFDILISLIKEMNLFNEDAIECGKYLNLRSEPRLYQVFEIYEGNEYRCENLLMASDATQIDIQRKSTAYILENSDTNSDWYLRIQLDQSIVEELPGVGYIISNERDKVKFKLLNVSFGDFKSVFA